MYTLLKAEGHPLNRWYTSVEFESLDEAREMARSARVFADCSTKIVESAALAEAAQGAMPEATLFLSVEELHAAQAADRAARERVRALPDLDKR